MHAPFNVCLFSGWFWASVWPWQLGQGLQGAITRSELCPEQGAQEHQKFVVFSCILHSEGAPGVSWQGQQLCLSPVPKAAHLQSSPSACSALFQNQQRIQEQEANCLQGVWKEGVSTEMGSWEVCSRFLGGSRSFPSEPVWSPSHDLCLSFPLSCAGFGASLAAILSSLEISLEHSEHPLPMPGMDFPVWCL